MNDYNFNYVNVKMDVMNDYNFNSVNAMNVELLSHAIK